MRNFDFNTTVSSQPNRDLLVCKQTKVAKTLERSVRRKGSKTQGSIANQKVYKPLSRIGQLL